MAFIFGFLNVFKSQRGIEMMSQILSKNYDVEMAEKCRIALEEDWGADVPMLKCMAKKANTQKNFKLF